ncbi:16S rRNA (uracil(1498)-N(3))-methyltransferase [Ferrovibrio sp.]|uniref:16S rRNA (uracil(1498)-N(3))-methyltransferase n=1 Tax=Ferrovibrio sp. TaxID=1917215 RepID=UPI002628CD37|nr:16S rRNA (uracil(1498)-N(3))-methyltransferase [Ferrovibrio sp.]
MSNIAKARLFVPADLNGGAEVALPPDQAHYLRHVLRLGEGDVVALFNGRDGEFHAVLSAMGKKDVRLQVGMQTRPFAAAADLWLCFAPIRQGRIEMVIEKATELGVGKLLPVQTRRCQIAKVNGERLSAIAREAAEQSERLDVPSIENLVTLEKLLAEWPTERRLYVCAERSEALPLLAALQSRPKDESCALLVGPEGGFAPEELESMLRHPAIVPVTLGPNILRAETAAIAALAILQAARQN